MKILITRPRAQSADFGAALQMAGFEPVYFPVIEIRPVEDLTALDRALAKINCYDWVVFTSVNGVEVFFDHIVGANGRSPLPDNLKIAAIGPKTAEALRERGIEPSFVPEEYVAEALLPGLGDLRGAWVLLPRAEIARKTLPEAIVAAGGVAHEIAVYHTLPAEADAEGLAELKAGVDVVTFTSPSTVHNFVQIVRQNGLDPFHLPAAPKIACIGPITERTAREEGFEVTIVAQEYTTEGLIQVINKLVNQ
ncbi:MAG: uroporphyrinogen-III synthase [Anaerolineales bacterium]|nr:uroporphyrinogen-III synthase [Anaerolineales bacterium]